MWQQTPRAKEPRTRFRGKIDTITMARVIHVINAANTRSIVVAKKLGSRQDGVWVREGKELLIYAQINPPI